MPPAPHRPPRPQLSDEVAVRIRDRIMTGRLRRGQHLHLERLAEELGVSVTPVREALLALRGEGFVQLEPRRGFTVVPLNRQDVADANRLRAGLAGELAARTAERITIAQLDGLEGVQADLEHATRFGIGDAVALDQHFHTAIYEVAESAKLDWFLRLASRYVPQRIGPATPGLTELTESEHREILRALRNRDAEAARWAMHEHAANTGRALLRYLDEQEIWAQ